MPAEPALTGTVFYGRCREFDSAKYPQHMLQGLVAAWNTRYVYVRSKEKSALAGVIRQVSQLTGRVYRIILPSATPVAVSTHRTVRAQIVIQSRHSLGAKPDGPPQPLWVSAVIVHKQ